MPITSTIRLNPEKLDSGDAYRAICRMLPTSESFAILTNIGSIVVEIIDKGFDIYDPVKVYVWDNAPETNFYKTAKLNKESYDYYCQFGLPKKNHLVYRRYFAALVVIEMMFLKGMKDLPSKKIVRACTKKFLHSVIGTSVSCDQLAEEFMKLNYSPAALKDSKVADLTLRHFEYLESEIDKTIKDATNIGLCELSNISVNSVYTNFEIFTFGIMRLIQKEDRLTSGGI